MVKMAKMTSEVNSVLSGHVLLIDDKHTTRASRSIMLGKLVLKLPERKTVKKHSVALRAETLTLFSRTSLCPKGMD